MSHFQFNCLVMLGFKFQLLPRWRRYKLQIPFNALAECGTQIPLVCGEKTTHFREASECRAAVAPSCTLYLYVEGRDSVIDKQYPEGSTTFIIDHEFINIV